MLDIPLTQNIAQAKLAPSHCQGCDPLSEVQAGNNDASEQSNSGMFAGLMNILLNMNADLEALTNNTSSALLPAGRDLELLHAGKQLPLMHRLGGNILPHETQLRHSRATDRVQPAEMDVPRISSIIDAIAREAPEQLELLRSFLPRNSLQEVTIPAFVKTDYSSAVGQIGELQQSQLGAAFNHINSFTNNPVAKEAALLVDIQKPGWEKMFAERVVWVINQGAQGARIQLNPPELGPLKIDLAMDGDQVNVNFIAQNLLAKEAIDLSMPKLREMFQHSGIELADTQVFDQKTQQQYQERANAKADEIVESHSTLSEDEATLGKQAKHEETLLTRTSLIDAYV